MKAVRHLMAIVFICAQRLLGERITLSVLRCCWRPGYVFLVYPGTEADVTHVMPRWLAGSPWVKSNPALIGLITGGHKVRRGLVFAISNNTRQLVRRDSKNDLRQIKDRLERIAEVVGAEAIAMAGQLPSIMARRSTLPGRCVEGVYGTVYSIDATLETLMPGDRGTVRGVIVGMGRIGQAMCELLSGELERLDGIDQRSQCGALTPADPRYRQVLENADAVVALTPRGEDAVPHLEHLNPRALIIDDTHPRLLSRDLSAVQIARTFKVALSSGARFLPRLSRYESNWLPGCALEAQVVASADHPIGSYEEFRQAARDLGVHALTIPLSNDGTAG